MSDHDQPPLDLRRIDASRNMHRFYLVALQPTLFGGASLMRNWGRIGGSGQSMVETFDTPEEANAARARLVRAKARRGYSAP
jgi:predicted DNA-binding WGR domain protein